MFGVIEHTNPIPLSKCIWAVAVAITRAVSPPAASVTVVSQVMPPAKPAGKKFEGASSAQTVAQLLRDEANII